jgi:hypothetical protein
MRFGHRLGPGSTIIQIDTALQPTHPRVDTFVSADVKSAAGQGPGCATAAAHTKPRDGALCDGTKKEADDDTQCRRRPPFMPGGGAISAWGFGL